MKLHFSWKDIEKLLEEINSAQTVKPLYGEATGKGFWLVGDQGVYLMANTSDGVHHGKLGANDKRPVAYAKECDPTRLEFDEWWENKRRSFGGDDGCEFISLADVMGLMVGTGKPKVLVIDITPNQFAMGVA